MAGRNIKDSIERRSRKLLAYANQLVDQVDCINRDSIVIIINIYIIISIYCLLCLFLFGSGVSSIICSWFKYLFLLQLPRTGSVAIDF